MVTVPWLAMTRPPEPSSVPLSVSEPAPANRQRVGHFLDGHIDDHGGPGGDVERRVGRQEDLDAIRCSGDGIGAGTADEDAAGAEGEVVVDRERITAARDDDVVEEIRSRREIVDVGELIGAGREDQRLIGVAGGGDAAEPVGRE